MAIGASGQPQAGQAGIGLQRQESLQGGSAQGISESQSAMFSKMEAANEQPAPKTNKSFFSLRNVGIAAAAFVTGIILAAAPVTAPVIGGLCIAGALVVGGCMAYKAMQHHYPEKMDKFESSMKEMLGGMVPGQGMSSQVVKNNNDNLIQESEKKFDIPPQMKQRMCGQALELLKTKPNSVDGWASLALLLEGNSEAEVRLPKETVKVNKKQAAQQALANMPSKPSIGQGQLVALLKPLVESEI